MEQTVEEDKFCAIFVSKHKKITMRQSVSDFRVIIENEVKRQKKWSQ